MSSRSTQIRPASAAKPRLPPTPKPRAPPTPKPVSTQLLTGIGAQFPKMPKSYTPPSTTPRPPAPKPYTSKLSVNGEPGLSCSAYAPCANRLQGTWVSSRPARPIPKEARCTTTEDRTPLPGSRMDAQRELPGSDSTMEARMTNRTPCTTA